MLVYIQGKSLKTASRPNKPVNVHMAAMVAKPNPVFIPESRPFDNEVPTAIKNAGPGLKIDTINTMLNAKITSKDIIEGYLLTALVSR